MIQGTRWTADMESCMENAFPYMPAKAARQHGLPSVSLSTTAHESGTSPARGFWVGIAVITGPAPDVAYSGPRPG